MSRLAKISFASFVRGLIALIGGLLLMAVGLDLIYASISLLYANEAAATSAAVSATGAEPFRPSEVLWIQWVPVQELRPQLLLTLGILCLVIPPLHVYVGWLNSRLARGIVGKGTDGEDICVAPEAIERAISRDVRAQVPEVKQVRFCSAVQGSKSARITVHVGVGDSAPVPQVRRKTVDVVKETMTQLIGYADPNQVRVKVTSIKPGGGSAPARKKVRKKRPAKQLPGGGEKGGNP